MSNSLANLEQISNVKRKSSRSKSSCFFDKQKIKNRERERRKKKYIFKMKLQDKCSHIHSIKHGIYEPTTPTPSILHFYGISFLLNKHKQKKNINHKQCM